MRVDANGDPHIVMGNDNWPSRVHLGPINHSDIAGESQRDSLPWGLELDGNSHDSSATLAIVPADGNRPANAFVHLRNDRTSWGHDAVGH